MEFQDKVIICAGCGKEFTHTVEEQKRHAEKGFSQTPKRCPECRQARKDKAAAKEANPPPSQEVGASGDFTGPPRERRGGGGGGGRRQGRGGSFGFSRGAGDAGDRPGGFGGSSGGGFSGGPRQSFDAVCAACGIKTTVPFEPTQGRQVYCRDCYRKMKDK